jgi:hypothetical protein
VVGFCGGEEDFVLGIRPRSRTNDQKTAECPAGMYGDRGKFESGLRPSCGTMIVLLGLERAFLRRLGRAIGFLGGRIVSRASLHPRTGLSAARYGSVALVAARRGQAEEDPEIRSAWPSQRIPRTCLAERKHIGQDM